MSRDELWKEKQIQEKIILILSPNVMYSPGFKLSFSIRTSMFIPLHPEDATLLIRMLHLDVGIYTDYHAFLYHHSRI